MVGYAFASSFTDVQGHWAQEQINKWSVNGLASGYSDGTFKPNNQVTRAEFVALVNRAFNIKSENATTDFTDVKPGSWYYENVAAAKTAGYIGGYTDGTFKPGQTISRQEAASILVRLLKLETTTEGVAQFEDSGQIPEWSRGNIGAVSQSGLMRGMPDNTFQPLKGITRAEAVVSLDRALEYVPGEVPQQPTSTAAVFDKSGTYGPATGTETVKGNVTIAVGDVTLQNTVIEGNLTIDKAVGEGTVTLKKVVVKGNTYINGGGTNSVYFIDTQTGQTYVLKDGGPVRIVASGTSEIAQLIAQSNVNVQEVDLTGKGFDGITVDKKVNGNITINLVDTKVESLDVKSEGVTVNADKDTNITTLVADAKVAVTGTGTVENATINASGVTFQTRPMAQTVATGVTAPSVSRSGGGGGGGSTTPLTYTITFDSNGGSAVAPITNVTSGATVTLPVAPTKEGFIFAGWYTDNTTFVNAFASVTAVTANVTVYAKWMEDTACGYVFDNNLTGTPQTVAVGSDVVFNSNGPLKGVTHTLGTSTITVNDAGSYNITFGISTQGNNPMVWGIAVNGVVQSLFNCGGQTIVESAKLSLNAGDIISIRNVATMPDPATLRIECNSAWVQIDKVNSAGGYVYENNTSTPAQSIAVGSDVMFNSNGPLQGVTHTTGTGTITVNNTGIYNIQFGISTASNNPQVWGIAVNGKVKSFFNNAGQAMVQSTKLSLNAGDTVSIRNVATVPDPATLRAVAGVNSAWVLIDKAAINSDNNGGESPPFVAVSTITVTSAGDATTVRNGATLQMSAAVEPADATNKSISWSVATLEGGTATINSSGSLKGTGLGAVRVTATNVICGVTGTKDITVIAPDKTALTAAINAEFSDGSARTTYVLTQSDYTSASWANYTSKITAAITVEGDPNSLQSVIDSAISNISKYKSRLVFAGKADLNTAKASAAAKIEADYTPFSWAALVDALALPETTNAEVVAKTEAINAAIAALVPDTTPAPDFALTYPKAGGIGYYTAEVLVKVNESGKAYWVVIADGSTAPNVAQVKAGQDSTGAAVAAGLSGSVDLTASTEATINIIGLTGETAYDIYVIAEDSESTPNLQAEPIKVDITTTAVPIPALTVSGTLTDGATEQEVQAGNQTIVLTLQNATFAEDVVSNETKRDALLAGLAAGRLYSEAYAGTGLLTGDQLTYDAVLKSLDDKTWTTADDQLDWAGVISAIKDIPANIVLNGDRTQVAITIPTVAGYDILFSQTIKVTVPDDVLDGVAADLTAAKPFVIDAILGALSWDGQNENDIVTGGKKITLTTTWPGGFANKVGGDKQNAFIDYFVAQSETDQWAKVKTSLYPPTRTVVYDAINKLVTITLQPVAGYDITEAQQIRYYFSTGLTGQTGGGTGGNGASFPIGIAVPTITIDTASGAEVLDTTAIDTAITAANAAKVGVVISVDGTDVLPGTYWVTQAVNDDLNNAITTATAANSTVTTALEVTNAASALEMAVGTYNAAKADGTKVVFPSKTDSTISNDVDALGLVGLTATSSDDTVATAVINAGTGKIDITSAKAGTATITVVDGSTPVHEATIDVTVADDGTITVGTITKFEDKSDFSVALNTSGDKYAKEVIQVKIDNAKNAAGENLQGFKNVVMKYNNSTVFAWDFYFVGGSTIVSIPATTFWDAVPGTYSLNFNVEGVSVDKNLDITIAGTMQQGGGGGPSPFECMGAYKTVLSGVYDSNDTVSVPTGLVAADTIEYKSIADDDFVIKLGFTKNAVPGDINDPLSKINQNISKVGLYNQNDPNTKMDSSIAQVVRIGDGATGNCFNERNNIFVLINNLPDGDYFLKLDDGIRANNDSLYTSEDSYIFFAEN